MRKIFLDLDGVFADFHRYVEKVCGFPYAENPEAVWKELDQIPCLFSKLDLLPGSLAMFHNIRVIAEEAGIRDYQIEFLTALPRRTGRLGTAVWDKAEWVYMHISDYHHVNIVDHWSKKKHFCQPGDILIDDAWRNCLDWTDAGGIAIVHDNVETTVSQLEGILDNENC